MAYFEIKNLHITHKSYEGVKDVLNIEHLAIERGETYGLVGESGQGKTVLALAIQQLLACPPGKIESGEVLLEGENLLKLSPRQMQQRVRGSRIAMIFQDPMSCLNPVFTVGSIMTDVLRKESDRGSRRPAPGGQARRRGEHPLQVPAPALRRSAPARHHCSGSRLRGGAADRGRAHKKPGCHHPGEHPETPERASAEARHDRSLHREQPEPGFGLLRPRRYPLWFRPSATASVSSTAAESSRRTPRQSSSPTRSRSTPKYCWKR